MGTKEAIKLFEEKRVRTAWDDEQEKWYFSIVDVVQVLTDSDYQTARKYWKVLKGRIVQEAGQPVTICYQLKMRAADGKMRLTDVADTEQLFRIIQSVPSPKAEPFKRWMAQVAAERVDQMQDPELSIHQAMADYKRLGYSDNWINQRLKSIEIRKDLTDQWRLHNVEEGVQYATLTDIIYQAWAGKTAKEYKQYKGLKKENLRDNMPTRYESVGCDDCRFIGTKELASRGCRRTGAQYAGRALYYEYHQSQRPAKPGGKHAVRCRRR